ncbi:MAG: SLC13 family permease [Alphaproteobacteria bacterium]|nr:SLC13 family permease [Alphaproteobacteria bacterium]
MYEQISVFTILGGLLVAFVWGGWRYDVVAFAGLLVAVLAGVVPLEGAFAGLGHPAVVTVAAVLIISRALANSGAIDIVARSIAPTTGHTTLHVIALVAVAAVLSAFMNNVGALALLLPVALQSAAKAGRSPALVLMPLSFGSILGGLATLIGTPPNIIVAAYRGKVMGEPFQMFDFTPVGGSVALLGVLFLAVVGWRLVPKERRARKAPEDLFEIEGYVTELKVPKESKAVDMPVPEVEKAVGDFELIVVGLIRRKRNIFAAARRETVRAGDILIVEAVPAAIDKLVSSLGLKLVSGKPFERGLLRSGDATLIEAVVQPGTRMTNRSALDLRLRGRGVNLVALSRQGRPMHERLLSTRFLPGDVVLLQGEEESLAEALGWLGCLPLAGRGLQMGKRHKAGLAVGIFTLAIGAAALNLLPLLLALALAVLAVVVFNLVSPREAYEAVDWPIIILLASLIPIGEALERTGGTALIAGGLLGLAGDMPAVVLLMLVMVVTMTLSDIMNNAATAVVMAPVAFGIAQAMGANPDAFLMAVAIGASCAFLTPIGHQNNMLVMGPGGYRFGDYWRMGLPLEALIVLIATPLILWVWPL